MKVYEILNLNKELLMKLFKIGISTRDWKFIEIYRDYNEMKKNGYKKIYIVAVLSDQYHLSERKIYSLIKFMEKDCTNGAV